MKRNKLLITLLTIALSVTAMASFASCGETEHTHDYGVAVETKSATCTEDGENTSTCECGDKKITKIPALGHNYENGECTRCHAPDPDAPSDNPIEETYVHTVLVATSQHAQLGTIYCVFEDVGSVSLKFIHPQAGLLTPGMGGFTYADGTLTVEAWSNDISATAIEGGYEISATQMGAGKVSVKITNEQLAKLSKVDDKYESFDLVAVSKDITTPQAMTMNFVVKNDGALEVSRTTGGQTTKLNDALWNYGENGFAVENWSACTYAVTLNEDGAVVHFEFRMQEGGSPMMTVDFDLTNEHLALFRICAPHTMD